PYSDGERDALTCGFANRRRCRKGANVAASLLLPVTIRGEGAGRRMRGSASARKIAQTDRTLLRQCRARLARCGRFTKQNLE
ncbi:MAG: hypothetical protein E5W55_33615, partial [Mesorhizobium sp.]